MSAPVVDGNEAEAGHIISTTIRGKNGEPKQTLSYMAEHVVGTGSFGTVFQAKSLETGETVAIKKVLQDRRYKNRELQLMRAMDHPNVVSLKHCFFSTTSRDEVFLNVVMEYVPETIYRVLKHYENLHISSEGLAYMHMVTGVCHRELKPQNVLVRGELNISYICSRFYRAPELIFGATEYTTSIDIWSAGCILAELLLGQPLFLGENAVDQLVKIIKVQFWAHQLENKSVALTRTTTISYFRKLRLIHGIRYVFHKRMPPEAIDLASRLLQYSPSLRCNALSQPNVHLPNGRPLPPLFDFKQEEHLWSSSTG
ncbi:putative protein-serine/threonine kinase CMGC-GSK family [Helianthus annuus]|nr:putative protein-serine/threonine kinase CMGC-GSK family [Helianthus annuus]